MIAIQLGALVAPKIPVFVRNVAPFFAILAVWAPAMMLRR